jgi:hypothetical protein
MQTDICQTIKSLLTKLTECPTIIRLKGFRLTTGRREESMMWACLEGK